MALTMKNLLRRAWNVRVGERLVPLAPLATVPLEDAELEAAEKAVATHPGKLMLTGQPAILAATPEQAAPPPSAPAVGATTPPPPPPTGSETPAEPTDTTTSDDEQE